MRIIKTSYNHNTSYDILTEHLIHENEELIRVRVCNTIHWSLVDKSQSHLPIPMRLDLYEPTYQKMMRIKKLKN